MNLIPTSVSRKLGLSTAEYPPDIAACLNTLCHAFVIGSADLFPLSQHQKDRLFDEQKIFNYAETHMHDETGVVKQLIEGSSISEFQQEFGLKMGGRTSMSPVLAAAAQSELRSSRREKDTAAFSQLRFIIYKKMLHLPADDSTLRDSRFLDAEANRKINAITTYEEGKEFLRIFGSVFVRKAYIGGSIIGTIRATTHENAVSHAAKLEAAFDAGPVASGDANVLLEQKRLKRTSTSNVYKKRIGGDIGETDDAQWRTTFEGKNRSLIQCEFAPIYLLATEPAQTFLFRAYQKMYTPIESGTEYIIRNKQDKRIVLALSNPPEARWWHRWWKPTLKPKKTAIASNNFEAIEPHVHGCRVKVQIWNGHEGYKEMSVAFTNSNGQYFDRKLQPFGRGQYHGPRDFGDAIDDGNEDDGDVIDEGPFITPSAASLRFVRICKDSDHPSSCEDVFKWSFTRVYES